MTHDFSTPEGRAAAIQTLGIDGYNRAHAEHRKASVIKTVAGHELRYVQTMFGRLVAVGGTKTAFATLHEAELFAHRHPKEGAR